MSQNIFTMHVRDNEQQALNDQRNLEATGYRVKIVKTWAAGKMKWLVNATMGTIKVLDDRKDTLRIRGPKKADLEELEKEEKG